MEMNAKAEKVKDFMRAKFEYGMHLVSMQTTTLKKAEELLNRATRWVANVKKSKLAKRARAAFRIEDVETCHGTAVQNLRNRLASAVTAVELDDSVRQQAQ